MTALRYLPFETVVDSAFWHSLADRKLNEYRLSEGPFPISVEFVNSHASGVSPRMSVDATAFTSSLCHRTYSSGGYFRMNGELLVFNSIDEFKNVDKQSLINEFGIRCVNDALQNNEFLKNPDMVSKFQLITYCDLKKHKFFFWFAYPAVLHSIQPTVMTIHCLDDEFSEKQISQFLSAYDVWREAHTSAFFSVFCGSNSLSVKSCTDFEVGNSSVYLGMCDSSVDPNFPSWLLRNMLYVICASLISEENNFEGYLFS